MNAAGKRSADTVVGVRFRSSVQK